MFAEINKIKMYYEKSGSGKPLIMVHGNGETHSVFDRAVNILNKHFTVYAVDSRGHGKSSTVKKFSYNDMADDMYCFITQLNIKDPIFYGFSDGGIIGLILASAHPDILSALIISGANLTPSGVKSGFLLSCKAAYFFTRSEKIRLMLKEPHITDKMLKNISVPTFVTCGSKDIVKLSETKHISETIKNAALKVFDGESHGSYICKSDKIAKYIIESL